MNFTVPVGSAPAPDTVAVSVIVSVREYESGDAVRVVVLLAVELHLATNWAKSIEPNPVAKS